MRYRITHRTSYRHSDTVPLCQNALWLTPRSDGRQRRETHRLDITPEPTTRGGRTDYFGNEVTYFSIDAGYRSLEIAAISEVRVDARPPDRLPDSPVWDRLAATLGDDLSRPGISACQFRHDSPGATASEELTEYARGSFPRGRPVAEAARDLTARVRRDFVYDPDATTVGTGVEQAFSLKRGVCQDFAQVEVACLRSLGLAARYVSGYLRTIPPPGAQRLIGADASHAWVGVYCGPAGWIDFDPTNDALCGPDHVTIAWGRDYGDVTPVRGLFVGGGRHQMEVTVDVAPIDEAGHEMNETGATL